MLIEIEGKTKKVPDFMIVGAMKCGTTSLHHILNSHPLIFIPDPEIHFYDMDNYCQHQDFLLYHKDRWYYPSFSKNILKSFEWYESFFQNAPENSLIGEDSTIYIASPIAPRRIAQYAPETKIIIMLRDPASRAYSHYSHLFLTGRLNCSFEEAIQKGFYNILDRSFYQQQIENFLRFLPRDNFQFILFEEFINNTEKITRQVLQFLGIPSKDFKINPVQGHQNMSKMPSNLKIQQIRNLMMSDYWRFQYAHFFSPLTGFPLADYYKKNKFHQLIDKINNLINPKQNKKFPPMKPEIRDFLNSYLKQQNEGLEEIIGKNLQDFWY